MPWHDSTVLSGLSCRACTLAVGAVCLRWLVGFATADQPTVGTAISQMQAKHADHRMSGVGRTSVCLCGGRLQSRVVDDGPKRKHASEGRETWVVCRGVVGFSLLCMCVCVFFFGCCFVVAGKMETTHPSLTEKKQRDQEEKARPREEQRGEQSWLLGVRSPGGSKSGSARW